MKIKCWIELKNDVVVSVFHSNVDQSHIMTEIPVNNDVIENTNIKWYDKNYKRITDKKLVGMGIRIDERGNYWDITNYKNMVVIDQFDVQPPEGFTDIPPFVNEPCLWNGESWVINEIEKERLSKILSINEVTEFVSGLVSEITGGNK
jgi:hypothetical protein